MKLSIIIPTYNEERTIEDIVSRIQAVKYPVEHEIIIVDDGSTVDISRKEGKKIKAKDFAAAIFTLLGNLNRKVR